MLAIHVHRQVPRLLRRSAAGVVYFDQGCRVLLLLRAASSRNGGTWGLPAGGIEAGETQEQAARREFWEETGFPMSGQLRVAYSDDDFVCYATHGPAFEPVLNAEHTAYCWAELEDLPSPLHPRLRAQLAVASLRLSALR